MNVGIESYGGVTPLPDEFPRDPPRVHTIDLPFLNALGRFHMKTSLPSGAEVYPARALTLAEATFDLTRMKEGVEDELLHWM